MMFQEKYSQGIFSIEINVNIAIIGGGINGLFTSWVLSQAGHQVELFEAKKVLSQTSASSSKLLHGGIRYLELGHIPLVRESLIDRHWWLQNAPLLCNPFEMHIPIYKNSNRSILRLFFGAQLYRFLAGRYSLGKSKWNSKKTSKLLNEIHSKNFKGSISFYDLQMNESALGLWVKENAVKSGVKIMENTQIKYFDINGNLNLPNGNKNSYDFIINITGPWASELNKRNMIATDYDLQLIRGSHLFINRKVNNYYLLQETIGRRILFVMPYLGKTLIGTTEVTQKIDDPIVCSNDELSYLISMYNQFFIDKISMDDVESTFSGLRPIIKKKNSRRLIPSIASRETKIFKNNKLLTLYGGKWTSAPSTAKKIHEKLHK